MPGIEFGLGKRRLDTPRLAAARAVPMFREKSSRSVNDPQRVRLGEGGVKEKINPNRITNCAQCPHFRQKLFSPNYCGKEGVILEPWISLTLAGDIYRIPDWCPLEDSK